MPPSALRSRNLAIGGYLAERLDEFDLVLGQWSRHG